MTQRHVNQMDMFAIGALEPPAEPPKPAKPEPPPPDPPHPLVVKISDAGIANGYSLRDANGKFGAVLADPKHKERPEPWNAPSRLFQFPCSLLTPKDGEPALLIWSTNNADHPFVREIADLTGLEPRLAEGEETWGFSQGNGQYHHAVDLISAGLWKVLLETREWTNAEAIRCAVDYGLDYGHLTTDEARQILSAIGMHETDEPTTLFDALHTVSLGECKQDDGRIARVVNWKLGLGHLANTYGRIYGLERGWFRYHGKSSRFLEWTDKAKTEQARLRKSDSQKPTDAASDNNRPDPEPDPPAPTRPKAKRERKAKSPATPPVVVAEPQLPPPGAFTKINGRWHVWVADDSLSGSHYGWEMCKPYWSRAHLSDEPPVLDKGGSRPKGWIKEPKGANRTVIVAGREFSCRPDEPDPVLTEVRGIPCVIDFHYGFGTHAVDRDKPFWSPSGFRSFGDHMVRSIEEAIPIIEAFIDNPDDLGGELMPWREFMPGGPGNGRFVEQPDAA